MKTNGTTTLFEAALRRGRGVAVAVALGLGALTCAAQSQAAQETFKFDAGLGLGVSGYLGDVNQSSLLKHNGLALEGTFRYLINTRLALRGNLTAAQLSGNSDDLDDVLPQGAHYEFKSWVYDLGGRFEFNFFNYGIGESYKQLHRLTPYTSLGLGVSLATCQGATYTALSLPISVGLKFKLKERVNLGAEFTMTKVLGDHLDGELSDLYLIKSSFLKNTDWFATLMFSVSYEFGRRCVVCNRLD